MAQGKTSGTYLWRLSNADIVLESFSRIQLYSPSLERLHLIEARRSANIIAQDYANRGVNLWNVGDEQLCLPLQPGIASYVAPIQTIDLLDCYLRNYTPGSASTNIGNGLTAIGPPSQPLVTVPYGDPVLIGPGSGTLSCIAGQQEITFAWPAHGQVAGNPIFWGCPISIGGLAISNFSIVDSVIDANTVTFLAPVPALETQSGQGATPLLFTTTSSGMVGCILPGHGLSVGSSFPIGIPTTVGGLTLSGSYTVASVQSAYQFTFTAANNATSTAMGFENGGQLNVTPQMPGVDFTDIFLYPLGRSDYAMLPDKLVEGRPTQFWFNRTYPPQVVMWPVPPTITAGEPPYYGFVGYRMRAMQDIGIGGGEVLDAPNRIVPAFIADLTASLAEKFRPELHQAKLLLAAAAWDRASREDREKVSLQIAPDFTNYSS